MCARICGRRRNPNERIREAVPWKEGKEGKAKEARRGRDTRNGWVDECGDEHMFTCPGSSAALNLGCVVSNYLSSQYLRRQDDDLSRQGEREKIRRGPPPEEVRPMMDKFWVPPTIMLLVFVLRRPVSSTPAPNQIRICGKTSETGLTSPKSEEAKVEATDNVSEGTAVLERCGALNLHAWPPKAAQ